MFGIVGLSVVIKGVLTITGSDKKRIFWIDAFFTAVSAYTQTGLVTVPLSQITTWMQASLSVGICLTCHNTIYVATTRARGRVTSVFEEKYFAQPEDERYRPEGFSSGRKIPERDLGAGLLRRTGAARRDSSGGDIEMDDLGAETPHVHFDDVILVSPPTWKTRLASAMGTLKFWKRSQDRRNGSHGHVNRNSEFHNLTYGERLCYEFLLHRGTDIELWLDISGTAGLLLALGGVNWYYMVHVHPEFSTRYGQNPMLNAIFTTMSSYSSAGMMLNDDSMAPFVEALLMLLANIVLIAAVNLAPPIFSRWRTVWVLKAYVWYYRLKYPQHQADTQRWGTTLEINVAAMKMILDHPRRNLMHVFSFRQTWWLFLYQVGHNGLDLMVFCVLNRSNPFFKGTSRSKYALMGLFNAFCVRTSGYTIVLMSALEWGNKAQILFMMTISQYPIGMTKRITNVFWSRAMTIYPDQLVVADHRVNQHPGVVVKLIYWVARKIGVEESLKLLEKQIEIHATDDLIVVFVAFLVICIIESFFGKKKGWTGLSSNFTTADAMAVWVEIISAYGNVGMSLGSETQATRLSGDLHWASKLTIMYVIYQGRHRGLPVAMDHAIEFHEVEEQAELEEADEDEMESRSLMAATSTRHFDDASDMVSQLVVDMA